MPRFIGTKEVKATPMTLGNYNHHRGWQIPDNEDPATKGYLIEYPDGYKSWSPKPQFDAAYNTDGNMSFGDALFLLKQGKLVARAGWNGEEMFLWYVPAGEYPARMEAIKGYFPNDKVPYGAYIAMKTAQGNVVPWLASQTDVLSEDWTEVIFPFDEE